MTDDGRIVSSDDFGSVLFQPQQPSNSGVSSQSARYCSHEKDLPSPFTDVSLVFALRYEWEADRRQKHHARAARRPHETVTITRDAKPS